VPYDVKDPFLARSYINEA